MVRLSGGMKKLTRSYLSDTLGMTKTVLKCVNALTYDLFYSIRAADLSLF
jgi:hypothetical protein